MARSHKELADRLGISITAVAYVREVLCGDSVHSRRALSETGSVLGAAQWLARFRGCYQVAEMITPAVVDDIAAVDHPGSLQARYLFK